MSTSRDDLRRLLATQSVLRGDFVLASGQRSNVYLDTRLTTTTARGMPLIGPAFIELFRAEGWWKPDAVIGPTLGADPILGAISYASAIINDPVDHLIVRKEAKGYGMGKQIEGSLNGVHSVVLVEDVWTSGGSSQKAVDAAVAAGLEVIGVAALVDREQGARELLAPLPTAALFTMKELLSAA